MIDELVAIPKAVLDRPAYVTGSFTEYRFFTVQEIGGIDSWLHTDGTVILIRIINRIDAGSCIIHCVLTKAAYIARLVSSY